MATVTRDDVIQLASQLRNLLEEGRYQQICDSLQTMNLSDLTSLHALLVSVQNDFTNIQKRAFETFDVARGTLNQAKTEAFLGGLHAQENDERAREAAASETVLQTLMETHD